LLAVQRDDVSERQQTAGEFRPDLSVGPCKQNFHGTTTMPQRGAPASVFRKASFCVCTCHVLARCVCTGALHSGGFSMARVQLALAKPLAAQPLTAKSSPRLPSTAAMHLALSGCIPEPW